MEKYNYTVKFKFSDNDNYTYSMCFNIEAETNQQAVIAGQQKWQEQINQRPRLQNAIVFKTTCRKIETKPRQPKRTQLQKALDALNNYIAEDLK